MRLISRNKNIMGGMYCIRGTRIPAVLIKCRLRNGESISSIAADYGLKTKYVRACKRFFKRKSA